MATPERIHMQAKSTWKVWCRGDIRNVLDVVRKLIPEHEDYMSRVSFGNRDDEYEPEHITIKDVTVLELVELLPAMNTPPPQSTIVPDYGISVTLSDQDAEQTWKGAFEIHAGNSAWTRDGMPPPATDSFVTIAASQEAISLQNRINKAISELRGHDYLES